MTAGLSRVVLIASLLLATVGQAQTSPAAQATPSPVEQSSGPLAPAAQLNVETPTVPCVKPPPTVSWRDYQGPFAKVVGIFGEKLELKSVHSPHYKPGAVLCTLNVQDKFILFVENSIAPATFLSAGFDAGISQAENDDPSYGQGAAGYGKRFGASMAGQASSEFLKDFAYPTIFSEDPRYYRRAHGSTGARLFHAISHSVVAFGEDGKPMFNFSEWLGTASAVVLANTYHPDNRRGFAPAARRFSYAIGSDIGFDVLREFWPEVARKFKLPFRDLSEPKN